MNFYFDRSRENNNSLPSGIGYARIANVEPGTSNDAPWRIAFDVIGSDWLQSIGTSDNRFNLREPPQMRQAWERTWLAFRESTPKEDPYERAELYRVLVTINPSQICDQVKDPTDLDAYIATIESIWFELIISTSKSDTLNILAEVYLNAFAAPLNGYVSIQPVGSELASALSILTDITLLPQIHINEVEKYLSSATADFLAVYDVGQGNANGLLGSISTDCSWPYSPSLYFDLGCGSSANKHTTPSPLVFCTGRKPVVVLSHWDEDHWMGANIPDQSGTLGALTLNWIAPKQKVTTHHMAFIGSVYAAGGKIWIYAATCAIGCASLSSSIGTQIRFAFGTGSSRNNSGIVLVVERMLGDGWLSWILPGDCEYDYFLKVLDPAPSIAVVVPHHGASPLKPATPAPTPHSSSYSRLVYSFGPNNQFGKVRHPTSACVQQHKLAGWNHAPWVIGGEGNVRPNINVRATSEHSGLGARGGILIGWTQPAVPSNCGRGCKTLPTSN